MAQGILWTVSVTLQSSDFHWDPSILWILNIVKEDITLSRLWHFQPWISLVSIKKHVLGERERWRRNGTGRSLSPSQIPQKNISTLSKLHKTTSVGWQRTSGNQKSRPLSSKTGRKKSKRRKRRQRRWGGSSVPGREARPRKGILRREVSKH